VPSALSPTELSIAMLIALAVIVLSIAVRLVTPNRLVRSKLRTPLALAALFPLFTLALPYSPFEPSVTDGIRVFAELGLALAVISFLVTVIANPLREDRVRTAVPNILQDAVIVGLFVVAGTILLREKFLTTSAIGAVVVGFALQDTLGNAFAGLAIQVEKPFHVGQWIRVGTYEGRVEEITWRATKLRTKDTNFVVVPNSTIAKEAIVNFSEPVMPTRLLIDVGVSYAAPPDTVKEALLEAVRNAALALAEPAPKVLLVEFGPSAIVYRVRFWITDFGRNEDAYDEVRTNLYYTLRRRGIEIPFPIQVQYIRRAEPARDPGLTAEFAGLLGGTGLFASLDDGERQALAELGEERLYTSGEAVMREGEPGGSMFVIASGRADVSIADAPVRTLGAGDFVGEMSMLTGERRAATVVAAEPCRLIEITSGAFRQFVLAKPHVFETMEPAVLARRTELVAVRDRALAERSVPVPDRSFLAQVRRFLRLPARRANGDAE
jgi:small-conductance mechanosensitive channel/CRP-like cAMP-binding protein